MIFRRNWTKKDQAQLLIELGRCLHDGYPLSTAIELQDYNRRPKLAEDMKYMYQAMRAGLAFHEGLRALRFPEEVVHAIYFAEAGGTLPTALMETGTMLQRREYFKERMRRFTRYPLFLLWVLFSIMFVIGRFLLPSFTQLYRSLSLDLPLITRMFLYIADHPESVLLILLISGSLFGFILFLFQKQPLMIRVKMISRLPIIGNAIRLYHTHQFSFHLGSFLGSGMTIKQSLHILTQEGTSPFLRSEAERIEKQLRSGYSLVSCVKRSIYYLPELVETIKQGERHGALDRSLSQYSTRLIRKMEQQSKQMLSLFQPVLLILVGGFVLIMFLSVLVPVFQMINGL
ncbi:competence type IV pilus assembly protein ComGB [Sporolactobacillus kofuensis]|uniref:Competence type IV pilus assembly protein ComGB n=1 Tax=Sporolactobacillus kofuensis TaxID=269672 RepID=A0ABW1WFD2_9BACL|nr:competence type IV pilus assembly protein ComGB [Sporolactobacillus kofuensis]MCO7176573.1 type II secretion system F family protein [Sporolactobacillus kofuensis]